MLLLISVGLLSAAVVPSAQSQSGMSLSVTTTDGTDITISGKTARADDVSVRIVNSSTGTIFYVGQQSPEADGTYKFHSSTNSEGWSEDGIYRVTAKQKDTAAYNLSVSLKVENGRIITENASKSSLSDPGTPDITVHKIPGLAIDVTADLGSEVIVIDGTTTSQSNAVTVLVTSPSGNKVHTDQLVPSPSGEFSTDINIGCPHWQESGDYVVSVQQGPNALFKKTAMVEIDECLVVPEFGAVAMAILAASIVAIVVLGARYRSSIMLGY